MTKFTPDEICIFQERHVAQLERQYIRKKDLEIGMFAYITFDDVELEITDDMLLKLDSRRDYYPYFALVTRIDETTFTVVKVDDLIKEREKEIDDYIKKFNFQITAAFLISCVLVLLLGVLIKS